MLLSIVGVSKCELGNKLTFSFCIKKIDSASEALKEAHVNEDASCVVLHVRRVPWERETQTRWQNICQLRRESGASEHVNCIFDLRLFLARLERGAREQELVFLLLKSKDSLAEVLCDLPRADGASVTLSDTTTLSRVTVASQQIEMFDAGSSEIDNWIYSLVLESCIFFCNEIKQQVIELSERKLSENLGNFK